MQLDPYQQLRSIREELYKSIQEALLKEDGTTAKIYDQGMTLYFSVKEREFRITSTMRNGYMELNLTVSEAVPNNESLETLKVFEVPELKMTNQDSVVKETFGRLSRGTFIGNSSTAVSIKDIGEEFKYHLHKYLSK